MKKNKTRIEETNNMRDLMGLKLINERTIGTGISDDEGDGVISGAPESEEALKNLDKEKKFEEGMVDIGVDAPESKDELAQDEKDHGPVVNEDSEGEETYNYGDDEGHDREEEEHLEDEEKMAPEDRIAEIERHLDALKKDMGYDEDHEDRDEEGTHFAEGKTFKIKRDGKIITLTEGDIKKINKKILK